MSSNGLWTTMENYHPLHSLHHPQLTRDTSSQDEPIDFSQKSDSSEKDSSPKTQVQKTGGHLADILSRGGYTSLEHLYLVRNATDISSMKPSEQKSANSRTPDSISRNLNCSPPTVGPYNRSSPDPLPRNVSCSPIAMVNNYPNRSSPSLVAASYHNGSRASPTRTGNCSPMTVSASYNHNRSSMVVSPSSHASESPDGKTSPLMSSPECNERLPNFGTICPTNLKGQKRSLEEEEYESSEKPSGPSVAHHMSNFTKQAANGSSRDMNHMSNFAKGQNRPSEAELDQYKREYASTPQETDDGHKYSPDTAAKSSEILAIQQPALAQLLLSGRPPSIPADAKPIDTKTTKSITDDLPRLSIPITSPMMIRKTNGSSPGGMMQPNHLHSAILANSVPFQAGFSPPVVMEDSSKITSSLVPMPNPWEVYPTQSYAHDDKKSRIVRPFKAFGNEILNSCKPEMLASMGGGGRSVAFDKYIKFRSEYMDGRHDQADSTRAITSPESVQRSNQDSNDSEVGESQHDQQQRRRSGTKFPDQHKDPAYWERRRKNNEAAKRSRDARRRKEDALAMTAKELLEDKMRMTMHMTFQLKEMRKLEEENRILKEREIALQNCLFHLERRCRECNKCSPALLGGAEDRKQHCNTN